MWPSRVTGALALARWLERLGGEKEFKNQKSKICHGGPPLQFWHSRCLRNPVRRPQLRKSLKMGKDGRVRRHSPHPKCPIVPPKPPNFLNAGSNENGIRWCPNLEDGSPSLHLLVDVLEEPPKTKRVATEGHPYNFFLERWEPFQLPIIN